MRKILCNLLYPVILVLITACTGQASTPIVSPHDRKPALQTPTPVALQAAVEREEQAVCSSFFKNNPETIVIQKILPPGAMMGSGNYYFLEKKGAMEYPGTGLAWVSQGLPPPVDVRQRSI